MSVFSAGMQHRTYIWQMSSLCFVLGLLLAAAWQTTTVISRTGVASARDGFYYGLPNSALSGTDAETLRHEKEKLVEREQEIKSQRDQITELEQKLAKGNDASGTLNKELQEMKFIAGLTVAQGPGIQVTLVDSKKPAQTVADRISQANLVHDTSIAEVVNELKATGAEAVSVNGQRIVATSPIRCVGPVVQINGIPASPPFVISAIGNTETLYGGMKTPGGVLDYVTRFDPEMAKIEKKSALTSSCVRRKHAVALRKARASEAGR